MSPSEDRRVIAVRASKKFGRNTCSVVDECFTDQELLDWLNYEHYNGSANTVAKALKEIATFEEIQRDRYNDIAATAF